jgi:hypothetical protein
MNAKKLLTLLMPAVLGGCVAIAEPEPSEDFENLREAMESFTRLGAASVTPFVTNSRYSEATLTSSHDGISRIKALDAFASHVATRCPWFVFKQNGQFKYGFAHNGFYYDIDATHTSTQLVITIRQSLYRKRNRTGPPSHTSLEDLLEGPGTDSKSFLPDPGRLSGAVSRSMAIGDTGLTASVGRGFYSDEPDRDIDFVRVSVLRESGKRSRVLFQRELTLEMVAPAKMNAPIAEVVTFDPATRVVEFDMGKSTHKFVLP